MANMQKRYKVAIPKLDRGLQLPPRGPGRNRENRVTRACTSCRRRKVKCSGDAPHCTNCQTNSLGCSYEQTRRDRLQESINLNHSFVILFAELSERLSGDDRKKIQDIIDTVKNDVMSPARSIGPLGKRARESSISSDSPDRGSSFENHVGVNLTASVGSNEDLNFLDENLLRTRESRETGYVEQNFGVQWFLSVQRQAQNNEIEPFGLSYGSSGIINTVFNERSNALHQHIQENHTIARHVTDATFFLDSDNIELDDIVNPYELPDPEVAEQLLNCYMENVHRSFPVVPLSFEDQMRRFIGSLKQHRALRVPDRWRALMNLIFAIGAKYSHLIGDEWQGNECDHLVFVARASQLLSTNNIVKFLSGPDLLLVQATAMLSFYFLVIGHVSSAWLMIGVSIRLALTLGLHLRNENKSTDTAKKEMLLRLWWSLHCIECLLTSVTGRPPVIASEDCTAPLPRVFPGEQPRTSENFQRPSKITAHRSLEQSPDTRDSSNDGKYLLGAITASLLTQRVLIGLYAPRTVAHSWQDVKGKSTSLLSDLEDWARNSLSGHLAPRSPQQPDIEREQLLLQISYWSTKLMITRPCLCQREQHLKNESDKYAHFNSAMARTCVDSARALTALFPDQPTLKFVYRKTPWWNIVHVMMQCIAVLLLEIANQGRHTDESTFQITGDIEKLMSWLCLMQNNDPVASRAYHVVRKFLHNAASTSQHTAEELLDEDLSNHQAANEQAFKGLGSLYTQPFDPSWAQGESFTKSPQTTGQHHYPSEEAASQYQDCAPNSSIDQWVYTGIPTERYRMPSTFANPSLSCDEELPVVDMYNPWLHPSFTDNSLEDLGDMDLMAMDNAPQHYQDAGDGTCGQTS